MAPERPKSMKERVEELRTRKEQALHAGSEQAVQVQHDKGKLTAREGSTGCSTRLFVEIDMLAVAWGDRLPAWTGGASPVTGW